MSENGGQRIWAMFDRIASRYDVLNRLLSFGLDQGWRRKVVEHLETLGSARLRLLDVATGTGDLMLALTEHSDKIAEAIGIDMSSRMLDEARKKIQSLNLENRIRLQQADAQKIPFADASFDVVTIAFCIRNVGHPNAALKEMHRVLKPGGRLVVLEFSLPKNRFIRASYLFYFRHILPTVGSWISKDSSAYRYLNKTVEKFAYGPAFVKMLEQADFVRVAFQLLTFGVATIYWADKDE